MGRVPDFSTDLTRMVPGLRTMALRALGDLQVADDVAQEAIARALQAIRAGRLADPSRMVGFVTSIARHIIVDHINALGRTTSIETVTVEWAAAQPDALAQLISAEQRAHLAAALAALAADDRYLLRLCYYDGLTPMQIARRVGENAVVVRKRKSRALERLREQFSKVSNPTVGHAPTKSPTIVHRPSMRLAAETGGVNDM